jgi:hypothetical protein
MSFAHHLKEWRSHSLTLPRKDISQHESLRHSALVALEIRRAIGLKNGFAILP